MAFEDARDYILKTAHQCFLYLVSDETGKIFRYIIKKKSHTDAKLWYVYNATGLLPFDHYVGYIMDNGTPFFKANTVGCPELDVASRDAFKFVFDRLVTKIHKLPGTLHILHDGTCSVCGRPLTDPESVRRGIGPKCRGDR